MHKTGLYIGRFQPFHKGHLSVVKRALKEVEKLIIVIGSAQYQNQEDNPFSAEERQDMIELSLRDAQIEPLIKGEKQYRIIPLKDIHDNDKWPEHVKRHVPPFDLIFAGDDGLVKELFEMHTNVPVKIIEEEIFIRGRKIREKMIEEADWEKWVTPSVANYLKKIKGTERLIQLNLLD